MDVMAFDLEIAAEIPEGCTDWRTLGKLGVTCAAGYSNAGPVLWHPITLVSGRFMSRLTGWQADELALELCQYGMHKGYLLTWNGLGFDFPVLAAEMTSDLLKRQLAWVALHRHIDMGFLMVCQLGYMCGLNAAALGAGVPGKTEGMHGDLAPVMWHKGRAEQDKVLEYVQQDSKCTYDTYMAILEAGRLTWTTKAGTPAKKPWLPMIVADGGDVSQRHMYTCRQALNCAEPDTSWMKEPRPRADFYQWALDLWPEVLDEDGAA